MNHDSKELIARYRLRAWCAGLTGTMMVANMALTLVPADAQSSSDATKAKQKKTTQQKSDKKTTKTPSKATSKATSQSTTKTATTPTKAVTTDVKIVPATAPATQATPGTTTAPATQGTTPTTGATTTGQPPSGFPDMGRRTGTTFAFEFRGLDIDNVLKFFSDRSGLTITKDPGLTGPVTIINPNQVTLDEAFRILQAVLYVRGFTAVQSSGVLQILPFRGAKNVSTILNGTTNPDGPTKVDARNQFMTQVIPVENLDAERLARELKELATPDASIIGSSSTNSIIVTDIASNVSRFISLVEALDKTTSTNTLMKIYALQRSDATLITQIINDLYNKISGRSNSGGQPQPGQPNFNPNNPNQQGASASRPTVVAVAEPTTNSVIVVASADNQERIARDIIGRFDGDDTNRLNTITRKINFSDAQSVADIVNSVLSNQRPGQGSSQLPSFQSRTFGGGFGGFFGGGGNTNTPQGSSDPFGKIVADPRTNTLLITANKDRMTTIMDLIDKLDVEVPVESTTFVFPLKNAQAQDVAYSLGQAFGTGSNTGLGNGNTFLNFGGNNSSNRSPFGITGGNSQRRLGSSSSSNPFGRSTRGAVPPGPPPAPGQSNFVDEQGINSNGASAFPQGIPGVMTDQGFVPTETPGDQNTGNALSRQVFGGGFGGGGFGGGFGGGGRNRLGVNASPQYGPGRNGGYSNLLQLQGNVYVTPAPGGDSVIVTTLPANYDAVRQIIEALDIVPRQVMIEVIVAEVTLSDDQKLGFSLSGNFARLFGLSNTAQGQVNLQSGTSATTFDATTQGAQFVINGSNYSSLLQAITTDNKSKVLATPRIFASNNQQANISIVQQVPYGVSTVSGVSNFVTTTPQFVPIGLQLQVTPRITRQGLVTIDVQQEADDLLRFQTIGSGTGSQTVPVVNQRTTDTEVTIQDGQTVVIGGLIRNNTGLNITKVPILSDIPLIGQFFRGHEVTHDRTELMIFMTPHVVSTVEEAHAESIRQSASLIKQIPDLPHQQPNLSLPVPPKGTKIDVNKLPRDAAGNPYYPGNLTPNGDTSSPSGKDAGTVKPDTGKSTGKPVEQKKPATNNNKPADTNPPANSTANPATSGNP